MWLTRVENGTVYWLAVSGDSVYGGDEFSFLIVKYELNVFCYFRI